jgi:putative FmdB family regulatory protein
MPIYEYECRDCHKKSSFLIMNLEREIPELRCKKCNSPGLDRIVSRVNVVKSEEARMESLADPSKLGGLDENDPQSVARWMKKMGKEMGEEMGGEDFDQMVDEAMMESERGEGSSSDDFGDDF